MMVSRLCLSGIPFIVKDYLLISVFALFKLSGDTFLLGVR